MHTSVHALAFGRLCEDVVALQIDSFTVSAAVDHGHGVHKKTRRGKRKRCLPYHKPPPPDHTRFEKQKRYNCAKHTVNNLLGYELLTIANLTQSAHLLSEREPSHRRHCTAERGDWSIDCIQRTMLIHGYQLRRWKPNTERDLVTTEGLHMVQCPPHPDSTEPVSHWIGVDGTRKMIMDSFSNYGKQAPGKPIQLSWANLQRKGASQGCIIFTIERTHLQT